MDSNTIKKKQGEESSDQQQHNSGNVKVVLRVRPLNQSELIQGMQTNIEFLDNLHVKLKLSNESELSKLEKPIFQFDFVCQLDTTQKQIFEVAAKPVVDSIFEGFNGTIFAYGQTSSGKTHTMQGPSIDDDELKGIIPRMVDDVFAKIKNGSEDFEFKIKVSICEIYMEKIRDLLDNSKQNLHVREDKQRGIYIQDITEAYVTDEQDVYNLMHQGNQNRAIGATNMNEGSSRSHMIFMMHVTQTDLRDQSAKSGKLYLVDLAGSEKIAKTGAEGKTLDEAKRINQSLSELGNVINALTDNKQQHIPYRNSKLTRVLQESLGGNARTTLIITCSPSPYNESETFSTLRFGARAKCIKNKPKVNKEWTVAELQILLTKAEEVIKKQEQQIIMLDMKIKEMGQQIPDFDKYYQQIQQFNCQQNGQDKNQVDHSQRERHYSLQINQQQNQTKNTPKRTQSEYEEDKNNIMDNTTSFDQEDDELQEGQSQSSSNLKNIQAEKEKDEEKKERILLEEKQKMKMVNLEEQILKQQDKIKELQEDYEFEKNNVQTQTQKLNYLRKEFTCQNAKIIAQTKDYEAIVQKYNDIMQIKQQQEELLQEKDDQLSQQQQILQKQIQEIEQLKIAKENIFAQLKEKNEELEIIQLVRFGKYSKQSDNNEVKNLDQSINSQINQIDNRQDVENLIFCLKAENKNLIQINLQLKDTLQKISQQKQIQNNEAIVKMIDQQQQNCAEINNKKQTLIDEEKMTVKRLVDLENIIDTKRQIIEQQDAELHRVKGENAKLQNELKNSINIDDNKKQVIELQQKIQQLEDEKVGIQKDLHNRIDKVIQLEQVNDEYKDKLTKEVEYKSLSERQKQKKTENLEQQVQNLTKLYSDLINNQQNQKINLQASEKKLQRKNERIIELEQELRKTQEELVIIKSKHEQLMEYNQESNCRISDEWYNSQQINMDYFGPQQNKTNYNNNGLKDMKNIKTVRGGQNNKRQLSNQIEAPIEMKDFPQKLQKLKHFNN